MCYGIPKRCWHIEYSCCRVPHGSGPEHTHFPNAGERLNIIWSVTLQTFASVGWQLPSFHRDERRQRRAKQPLLEELSTWQLWHERTLNGWTPFICIIQCVHEFLIAIVFAEIFIVYKVWFLKWSMVFQNYYYGQMYQHMWIWTDDLIYCCPLCFPEATHSSTVNKQLQRPLKLELFSSLAAHTATVWVMRFAQGYCALIQFLPSQWWDVSQGRGDRVWL